MDAGDFGHSSPGMGIAWPTTGFVASTFPAMKVDAWTPGERELYFGADSLQALVRLARVPPVSANLSDRSGTLLFEESRIVELGGLEIGLTAVTRDSFPGIPRFAGGRYSEFTLKDPWTSLREAIPRLRERADLVIVLAHLPAEEADSLVRNIPGIDVIVVGHNPGYVAVQKIEDTMLIRPSNQGKQVARAHLRVDASGRIVDHKGFEDTLKDGVREEPAVARAVSRFRRAHGIKDPPKVEIPKTGSAGH